MRLHHVVVPLVCAIGLLGPPAAAAATGSAAPSATQQGADGSSGSGGAGLTQTPGTVAPRASSPSRPVVPGSVAKIIHGVAYAPADAPIQVQRAIWAGNKIRLTPYRWGGGHATFRAAGYDCSGSISYALHAAGLLPAPMDSSAFMSWGSQGVGRWITVYTNPGHAYLVIAGIRMDTSSEDDPNPAPGTGPRWRPLRHANPGVQARHPTSL